MPRYDYRCQQCGHIYEKREGFDAPSLQVCPQCSGTARRVLTPPAIVFKGSGWYSTDNRKSGNGAHSDGSAKGDEKAETKSDAAGTAKGENTNESPSPAASGTDSAPKPEKAAKAAAAD